MRKILKNIAVVFLWLAGAIIIAHSVIPHDHHPDYPGWGDESSCQAEKKEAAHHHSLPLHCHALNDLTCEKFTFVFHADHEGFSCFVSPAPHVLSDPRIPNSNQFKFPGIQGPLFSANWAETFSLRAPPSII